jgi:hypothetical protein
MAAQEITDRQVQAFRAFVDRLPHGKDLDLVILKAHLLIEEQVNALLRERLANPRVLLDEERFESFYRICAAQALFPPDFQPWLWQALKILNKLRNRVAHQIQPKGRDDLLEDLINAIPGGVAAEPIGLQERFEFTLWSLFVAVSDLVDSSGVEPGND